MLYEIDNQYPFFPITYPTLLAISACFSESLFFTIPGIDPFRSASEM